MVDAIVVFVTAPSMEVAAGIGRTLVEERLAACANLIGGVRSIYRWQNRVEDESEILMLIKTTRQRFEALRARVLALHPYEVPEVVALGIDEGSEKYLAWIAAESS